MLSRRFVLHLLKLFHKIVGELRGSCSVRASCDDHPLFGLGAGLERGGETVVARDTFRLADTVRMHDTTFVVLDRERVEWRDSLCTVWASGVRPSVDSVRHYVTERVITNTVTVPGPRKVTRWGVGVQAGYGVSDKGLTPYVGVGLSYNLLAW